MNTCLCCLFSFGTHSNNNDTKQEQYIKFKGNGNNQKEQKQTTARRTNNETEVRKADGSGGRRDAHVRGQFGMVKFTLKSIETNVLTY